MKKWLSMRQTEKEMRVVGFGEEGTGQSPSIELNCGPIRGKGRERDREGYVYACE